MSGSSRASSRRRTRRPRATSPRPSPGSRGTLRSTARRAGAAGEMAGETLIDGPGRCQHHRGRPQAARAHASVSPGGGHTWPHTCDSRSGPHCTRLAAGAAAPDTGGMNDDWRVEVDVARRGGLQHLRDSMHERGIAREAGRDLADRVKITVDDDRLFAYAETEDDARAAERRLLELAAEHGLQASATVARWHPEEERWEPAGVPLPSTPEEHAAEHAALEARQAAETDERGYAMWEVRLEL